MDEVAERIWNNGCFLIAIDYYGYKISLYSLGTDFYEIFYNPRTNEIEKISLATEDDLKKYLNRISISF
ncbi:MAG TPA: hypothetical protein DGG95_04750 [Cytophagales bacterium]|jgi:hypothetical protein|nr:hypothetical protein [Cytophagales bacterium]